MTRQPWTNQKLARAFWTMLWCCSGVHHVHQSYDEWVCACVKNFMNTTKVSPMDHRVGCINCGDSPYMKQRKNGTLAGISQRPCIYAVAVYSTVYISVYSIYAIYTIYCIYYVKAFLLLVLLGLLGHFDIWFNENPKHEDLAVREPNQSWELYLTYNN